MVKNVGQCQTKVYPNLMSDIPIPTCQSSVDSRIS